MYALRAFRCYLGSALEILENQTIPLRDIFENFETQRLPGRIGSPVRFPLIPYYISCIVHLTDITDHTLGNNVACNSMNQIIFPAKH